MSTMVKVLMRNGRNFEAPSQNVDNIKRMFKNEILDIVYPNQEPDEAPDFLKNVNEEVKDAPKGDKLVEEIPDGTLFTLEGLMQLEKPKAMEIAIELADAKKIDHPHHMLGLKKLAAFILENQ